MTSPKSLADDGARRIAIAVHDRSFLVEAGAGSGKTAVMAGRIAMLMAAGVAPRNIAAVTFTELAASELVIRVREFVNDLAAGHIPAELRIALPAGLSEEQCRHLLAAVATIDEMACSTIHSLCQRLIAPYPVEANIDPGARVMDKDQADITFAELSDSWLRCALAGDGGDLIAELVLQDPQATIELLNRVLTKLRTNRSLTVDTPSSVVPFISAFQQAADGFAAFIKNAAAAEAETVEIAKMFSDMANDPAMPHLADTPKYLIRILLTEPPSNLCTNDGAFKAYRKKSKWVEMARREGLSRADGERLNSAAEDLYAACCRTWSEALETAAACVLSELVGLLRSVVENFHAYKRAAALLDFDDLIHAARDLLRDHDDVRRALAARFTHVLVDEVQDTDTLQTEIFWRLCGDPPDEATDNDWNRYRIRPGALFLVGDPKQAIYRFRGADVGAYLDARNKFHGAASDSILSISTNFRSLAPILEYVNQRFEQPLSAEKGQPGFVPLEAFLDAEPGGPPCVVALDVTVADEEGKANAERQRDREADAVADMCARLIGNRTITDRKSGTARPCRAGDIALLAPTGKDLWRYEEALEQRGIPVATQAGKGFYKRQEIQDIIALTRVLADPRDTLALGALLRGPVVGLTEEELLDLVWNLPRPEGSEDTLSRLDIGVDPAVIANRHARDIIEKLQGLRRKVHTTTPHDLLSQAVDVLRLRAILVMRHRGQAERALANVDRFLSLSRAFAVRGLRAFAETMTTAWTDETRAGEGRPDAQEEAVALYSMHAAKGLEWPIVVPVNTMTSIISPESAVIDRATGRLYCPVFKVRPTGYATARDAEKAEFERERIRLWYVATTRARELLVLPRLNVQPRKGTWISILDLDLQSLPPLDVAHLSSGMGSAGPLPQNNQTRAAFADEATVIMDRQRRVVWLTPSRDDEAGPILQPETPIIMMTAADIPGTAEDIPVTVRGSRQRGIILHKLMEELLTGELADTGDKLLARATELIWMLGHQVVQNPAQGLSAVEIAGCVSRTLAIPEIASLWTRLMAELPVYASTTTAAREEVIVGVADAVALTPNGNPEIVIDWKSDVSPSAATLEHYRGQVGAYLNVTKAARGLIVLMTTGKVIEVQSSV